MHPLLRDFCIATETLLGLPIIIVLRYTDHPDEQEKDYVDNTILTQPKQEKIMQTLQPPTRMCRSTIQCALIKSKLIAPGLRLRRH